MEGILYQSISGLSDNISLLIGFQSSWLQDFFHPLYVIYSIPSFLTRSMPVPWLYGCLCDQLNTKFLASWLSKSWWLRLGNRWLLYRFHMVFPMVLAIPCNFTAEVPVSFPVWISWPVRCFWDRLVRDTSGSKRGDMPLITVQTWVRKLPWSGFIWGLTGVIQQ